MVSRIHDTHLVVLTSGLNFGELLSLAIAIAKTKVIISEFQPFQSSSLLSMLLNSTR